jgi:phosphatidate cytidylyltransferase
MFFKRFLTVLVLVPLTVWVILGTSTAVFQIITAIFCLIAAWEWATLINVKTRYNKFVYLVLMLAALSVVQFIPYNYVLWLGLIWWLIACYVLWRYIRKQNDKRYQFILALVGFIAIVPCWVGMNSLRTAGIEDSGRWVLVFLFLLWATDSGAYLFGMKFGKRKLAPNLSPGKTIEGALGGILFMLVFAVIGIWFLQIPSEKWLTYFLVCIALSFFSIIGDLFESMLKRKHNVKDSGIIFPGHGGMLDRLDSTLAAAPVFALLVLLTGLVGG